MSKRGIDGAGKSSIGDATLRDHRAEYYNPDKAIRRIQAVNPGMDEATANSVAVKERVRQLATAIAAQRDYAFETTLGGHTIPRLLARSALAGMEVQMGYVALDDVERYLTRIQARVANDGHDIPADKVRERYTTGRANLIQLMHCLSALRVFRELSLAPFCCLT